MPLKNTNPQVKSDKIRRSTIDDESVKWLNSEMSEFILEQEWDKSNTPSFLQHLQQCCTEYTKLYITVFKEMKWSSHDATLVAQNVINIHLQQHQICQAEKANKLLHDGNDIAMNTNQLLRQSAIMTDQVEVDPSVIPFLLGKQGNPGRIGQIRTALCSNCSSSIAVTMKDQEGHVICSGGPRVKTAFIVVSGTHADLTTAMSIVNTHLTKLYTWWEKKRQDKTAHTRK